MTPTIPDPLADLRQATASRHTVLDHAMPLAAPAPTLDDYGNHLRLLHAWLLPLRDWQAGFKDGPQDPALWQTDDALAQIAADLRAASFDAHADAPAATPAATPPARTPAPVSRWPWPPAASAAYRWGVMYVVEGSRLGGAVLYRQLAARLAPHPLHYLGAGGAAPGPRWLRFMAALRAAVTTEAQLADARAGACAAFDALLALLPRLPGNRPAPLPGNLPIPSPAPSADHAGPAQAAA